MKFEKRREHHAIGEFAAVMRFFRPLDAEPYSKVVGELRAFAEENRLPAPLTGTTFMFDLSGGSPQAQPSIQTAGWQRFAPDGEPELTIMCEPQEISYISRRYTTWADMLPKICGFLSRIAPFYIETVPGVSAFQVRYLNEFRSLSSAADSGKEIFREDSRWLPGTFKSFSDAWHSHVGAFEDVSAQSRRLVNVNVDCKTALVESQDHPATLLNLLFIVAQNFDLLGMPPLILEKSNLSDNIRLHLDALHTREKELLSEVLSDQYLVSVGAKENL